MAASTSPGYPRISGHDVIPIELVAVPGAAGEPVPADPDVADTWFRATFSAAPVLPGEEVHLRVGGLATLAGVELNGEPLFESASMYLTHDLDVGALLRDENDLVVRCRALAPALAERRRPRARWRTRVVRDNGLRWIRTSILGRAPGFAPGPPSVGPWRPVWLERRRVLAVDELTVRATLDGDTGVLRVSAAIRALGDARVRAVDVLSSGPSGGHRTGLKILPGDHGSGAVTATGMLRIPSVERWWPHTHGTPTLHDVHLVVTVGEAAIEVSAGRVGFRTLAAGPDADHDTERDGLDLHVNGVRIFARGALWMPVSSDVELFDTLEAVRAAGMNMLRIPGIGRYESEAFHDRCDELGILVWQDAAFANLDYPFADPAFHDLCVLELRQLLARVAGRPSLAVICGNSEVEQQVAMLGLPSDQWRDPFYAETIPMLVREATSDAIVLPSAPFGGDRPFQPDRGVANYYGVGGYRRPVSDARAASVRFAAECLAFANVPDDETIRRILPDAPGEVVVHHPAWKAAVPRDNGSGWDFEDVRDHYLRTWSGIDPDELRRVDHARYLELSRAVSGEVMAEVFGEWRRAGSPCGGALVLWLRDLLPGAGWGVLDDHGAPKVAYHHLRRALAPIAVWTTDEGLAGIAVHVANDGPDPLNADLRVALYRDDGSPVAEDRTPVSLGEHDQASYDLETLLGGFVDASWAYRFGPPGHDLIVASLERTVDTGVLLLSQAMRTMPGRVREPQTADQLGLSACAEPGADGSIEVRIRSRRAAGGVRLAAPGFRSDDDAFGVEPGHERRVRLHPVQDGATTRTVPAMFVTALDLVGRVPVAMEAAR